MNLCTNSAHAMGSKPGLLEIVLDEVLVGGEGIPCPPGVSPGPYVRLQVRDTGCGIPESIRHKIFDPYFTTKKPGQGTGLGLAVVHGIVKDHGGFIQVESETGKGTAVRVFIPAVAEPATAEPPTSESPLPRGTGRILLVDDEESVVTLGREMLQKVGYRVETDTDPRAALERIRSAPHAFDLVITDLTMPHMTGVDLAEEAARIRSDLPVILCTGYHEASQTLKPNGNIRAVLSKPFLTKDLAEAVAQAVQSPPASNTAQ
jgi:CheY-like chemotaxis protein